MRVRMDQRAWKEANEVGGPTMGERLGVMLRGNESQAVRACTYLTRASPSASYASRLPAPMSCSTSAMSARRLAAAVLGVSVERIALARNFLAGDVLVLRCKCQRVAASGRARICSLCGCERLGGAALAKRGHGVAADAPGRLRTGEAAGAPQGSRRLNEL